MVKGSGAVMPDPFCASDADRTAWCGTSGRRAQPRAEHGVVGETEFARGEASVATIADDPRALNGHRSMGKPARGAGEDGQQHPFASHPARASLRCEASSDERHR
jgi:hypothetical protein